MTNAEPFSIVIRPDVLLVTAVIEAEDDFKRLSAALDVAGTAFFVALPQTEEARDEP